MAAHPPTPSTARRATRQKALIDEVMSTGDAFVSAQSIHHDLRARGERVGLATVYRNLQTLVADGEVDTIRNEDGEVLYRRCSPQHHHHLVCRSCQKVVEVTGPAIESWTQQAAKQHGFREVSHTIELFGTCADCAAQG